MFDRFQIVLGYKVYFMLRHKGQWSREYARLSKINTYFSEGRGENALNLEHEENEIAREVYLNLCAKNKTPHPENEPIRA
jgi:hypothetical protein